MLILIFVQDLKKAVIANRPVNVAEFCAAYCTAIATHQPVPATLPIQDSPVKYLKTVSAATENTVNVENSLIRVADIRLPSFHDSTEFEESNNAQLSLEDSDEDDEDDYAANKQLPLRQISQNSVL